MKIIYKERQSGKTTELIKLCAEQFLYMVCIDHNECYRVAALAQEMGLDIPFPLTFQQFINGAYYRTGIKGFCIDNIDILIKQIANAPVVAISLSKEKEKEPAPKPPGGPPLTIISESLLTGSNCNVCGSSLHRTRKWFGKDKYNGCIQPHCINYHQPPPFPRIKVWTKSGWQREQFKTNCNVAIDQIELISGYQPIGNGGLPGKPPSKK